MTRVIEMCNSLSKLFAWAGGAVLLCSAALISLDVVFRALFKATIFESFELSTYAFAIATAFGLAFALSTKAHIRIEVVYNALPLRLRAWLDVMSYAVLSLAAGVLLYWCAATVFANAQSGARSNSALSVPLAIPQGLWLAGLAWFALVAIICTVAGVWTLLRKGPQAATSLLGVASLQEEIEASAPDLPAPVAGMERAA